MRDGLPKVFKSFNFTLLYRKINRTIKIDGALFLIRILVIKPNFSAPNYCLVLILSVSRMIEEGLGLIDFKCNYVSQIMCKKLFKFILQGIA